MYQLVVEVLDHAPKGLTPAEVLVLVAIAENSRTIGEVREISTATLCRRARVDARGLRHVIARLAKNGIEVRVSIGNDRRGRPLYATPGRVPRWRLPPMPADPGCGCGTCIATTTKSTELPAPGGSTDFSAAITPAQRGGIAGPPSDEGGHRSSPAGHARPADGHEGPFAGVAGPPYPSETVAVIDQPRRPTLDYVITVTGATEQEARAVLKLLTDRHRPRSIGAYVRGIPVDDLCELLAELRDVVAAAPASLAPQCDACGPNRLIELASGGVARCPNCHPRARTRQTA